MWNRGCLKKGGTEFNDQTFKKGDDSSLEGFPTSAHPAARHTAHTGDLIYPSALKGLGPHIIFTQSLGSHQVLRGSGQQQKQIPKIKTNYGGKRGSSTKALVKCLCLLFGLKGCEWTPFEKLWTDTLSPTSQPPTWQKNNKTEKEKNLPPSYITPWAPAVKWTFCL